MNALPTPDAMWWYIFQIDERYISIEYTDFPKDIITGETAV